MTCDDRGPDLVAHLLGQLEPDASGALRGHLAACAECRGELERLREVQAATLASDEIEPSPDTLPRLLESVRDEAVERRRLAATAPAGAGDCGGLGPEVVALALDQLEGAERTRAEGHVATCAPCQADYAAARRFATASQAAGTAEPAPGTLRRLLARIASEPRGPAAGGDPLDAVPDPARRSRRPGPLGWAIPLAIAAGLLVAVVLSPEDGREAVVRRGSATWYQVATESDGARRLDPASGRFEFAVGDAVEAGHEPFSVCVACGGEADLDVSPDREAPGVVRMTLAPGARVERLSPTEFELLAGQLELHAGPITPPLVVRSGDLYARVRGTRFVTSAAERRLVVVVRKGRVEIGRRGPDPLSAVLEAGSQGLVDADRILSRDADSRLHGDAFLAPRASLTGPDVLRAGDPLRLTAELREGGAGPVTIAGFDPSLPLFVVRLKRVGGAERSVTIGRSMLDGPRGGSVADRRTVRLTDATPYRLEFALPGAELEPGRWEARLRYTSYRAHSQGAEWLGVVESEALRFRVVESGD